MATLPQAQTKASGGKGGTAFKEIFPEGGILVGFDVWQGPYAGAESVIFGFKPIYQTLSGRHRGKAQGKQTGELTTVEAKEGDAVTGASIRTGSVVDGLQVMYQKIDYFGFKLSASSSYKSDPLGGDGGARRISPLTTNGKPVVGIFGGAGLAIDRIGLIYVNK